MDTCGGGCPLSREHGDYVCLEQHSDDVTPHSYAQRRRRPGVYWTRVPFLAALSQSFLISDRAARIGDLAADRVRGVATPRRRLLPC